MKRSLSSILAAAAIVLMVAGAFLWKEHYLNAAGEAPGSAITPTANSTNDLIHSTSPYLLEHAHDPVHWRMWGDAALAEAKRLDKPIFLTIGYSACHWCHVMQHEDFQNETIAKFLNDNFVPIAVDREQRPDLDAQYIEAVELMTGSGGWPLSVFLTPAGQPFFGGTYFPPTEFSDLLHKVASAYHTQHDEVLKGAASVAARQRQMAESLSGSSIPPDALQKTINGLEDRYDPQEGGFGPGPKFPEEANLQFLLDRYRATGDKKLLAMVSQTLNHLANGGVYDQIGGGFHRYSTDRAWRVPHFEKMLYDQALLIPIYLQAYSLTGNTRYRQVAIETLDFSTRELGAPNHGYYSSLDADSEGQEGKYYLWTPAQVKTILGPSAALFDQIFGITSEGDLDGKSILHLDGPRGGSPTVTATVSLLQLNPLQQKMLAARQRRVPPARDEKILASWNGLMIGADAEAYRVLRDEKYRSWAISAAQFVLGKMMKDGHLMHADYNGQASVDGLLEDYAFMADGLLKLYRATGDQQWLTRSKSLANEMIANFWDSQHGGFYSSAAAEGPLFRRKEGEDNGVPSANGIAARVLAELGAITGNPSWRQRALQTVRAFGPAITQAPSAFPTLLSAYDMAGGFSNAFPAGSPITNPVSVTVSSARLNGKVGSSYSLLIHLNIRSGWHINAHKPSASYLVGTTIELAPGSGAKITSVQYPAGQPYALASSSEPLSVYGGAVALHVTLSRPATAGPGPRTIRLILHYQACNSRACLLPTQTVVDVPLEL